MGDSWLKYTLSEFAQDGPDPLAIRHWDPIDTPRYTHRVTRKSPDIEEIPVEGQEGCYARRATPSAPVPKHPNTPKRESLDHSSQPAWKLNESLRRLVSLEGIPWPECIPPRAAPVGACVATPRVRRDKEEDFQPQ